jgi:hypothetical protein
MNIFYLEYRIIIIKKRAKAIKNNYIGRLKRIVEQASGRGRRKRLNLNLVY